MMDFMEGRKSTSLNESSYIPGLVYTEMNSLFPKNIAQSLQGALHSFGTKMRGYMCQDANLIGLESRTSSPVRITRNKELLSHVDITNLYPCGEGAGYAGGIVSSAIDGQNAAKQLQLKYESL